MMPAATITVASSVWAVILRQIAAEFSEERSYQEWLAQNGLAERFTGNHAALREILPKIGARYRQLIIPGPATANLHRHGRPAQGHPDPGALSETTMTRSRA